jgi:hypothetical protein
MQKMMTGMRKSHVIENELNSVLSKTRETLLFLVAQSFHFYEGFLSVWGHLWFVECADLRKQRGSKGTLG